MKTEKLVSVEVDLDDALVAQLKAIKIKGCKTIEEKAAKLVTDYYPDILPAINGWGFFYFCIATVSMALPEPVQTTLYCLQHLNRGYVVPHTAGTPMFYL